MMNQQAQKLGMKNTNFVNSTGLPDPKHYSTAYDLALLAAALIREFPGALQAERATGVPLQQHHAGEPQPPALDRSLRGRREDRAPRGRRLLPDRLGEAWQPAPDLGGDRHRTPRRRVRPRARSCSITASSSTTRSRLYARDQTVATLRVWKGAENDVRIGFDQDFFLALPGRRREASGLDGDAAAAPRAARSRQKVGMLKLSLRGEAARRVSAGGARERARRRLFRPRHRTRSGCWLPPVSDPDCLPERRRGCPSLRPACRCRTAASSSATASTR